MGALEANRRDIAVIIALVAKEVRSQRVVSNIFVSAIAVLVAACLSAIATEHSSVTLLRLFAPWQPPNSADQPATRGYR